MAASGGPALPPGGSPRPTSPFAATAGTAIGGRPTDYTPPSVLQRIMLQHCLDEEEQSGLDNGGDNAQSGRARTAGTGGGDVLPAGVYEAGAAGENGGQGINGGAVVSGESTAARPGLEPAYNFSPPPTAAQMAANVDKFESSFMERIVRTWPQVPNTALSKKAREEGEVCSGATADALKGTNVEMKTWALRIAVAMRFANFVGRTVCVPTRGPRPSDEELDRGVAKFFACLNLQTQEVINCFLDARRSALPVAGGGAKVMERTLKGYSAAVGFLFTNARVNGKTGTKLVVDCDGVRSPWQKKGEMEKLKEKQTVRADPGDYIGNPMETETIKDHKGAAEKEARRGGQHNKTSADVTPAMLSLLYGALVGAHQRAGPVDQQASAHAVPPGSGAASEPPATPSAGDSATTPSRAPTRPVATTPSAAVRDAASSNLSARQTDFLAYVFYAFLYKTLARPWTLIILKYRDITLPDQLVAANVQFQNRYAVERGYEGRCDCREHWRPAWWRSFWREWDSFACQGRNNVVAVLGFEACMVTMSSRWRPACA